ncbi:MAG: hypothetical protein AAGJ82_15410, partial [Bacteroidota bacterium]
LRLNRCTHHTHAVTSQLIHVFDRLCGGKIANTASMVPVYAYGQGSEAFAGIYENTEIYHKIRNYFNWGVVK